MSGPVRQILVNGEPTNGRFDDTHVWGAGGLLTGDARTPPAAVGATERYRSRTLRFDVGTCAGCGLWTLGSGGASYFALGRAELGTCAVMGDEWPGWYTACTEWADPAGEEAAPPRRLTCACCGAVTQGRPWPNRDAGFGVCLPCADANTARHGEGCAADSPLAQTTYCLYGRRGVHFGLPGGMP